MLIVNKNTKNYKYLGIIIDSNLNWSEHLETIKTKFKKHWVYYIKQIIFLMKNSYT